MTESQGGLSIAALAIAPTHLHALIPYSGRDIHTTLKWLADQTTKAIHKQTAPPHKGPPHTGPVWCKGKWCGYVYDQQHWENIGRYIRRHNAPTCKPATTGRELREVRAHALPEGVGYEVAS